MTTGSRGVRRCVAVAIAFIAGFVACSDEPSGPPDVIQLSSVVIVSEPTSGSGQPLVGQFASVSAASAAAEIAYVSLASGSFPDAALAVVRHRASGLVVTRPMVDGGLDPVPVLASVGDTIVVELEGGAGTIVERLYSIVPASRRPRVVRTVPARRKTDVPLNLRAQIVFSEPIASTSLDGISLDFGGGQVVGNSTLSADGLRAEFFPGQNLAPNSEYVLAISTSVADREGDHLQDPVFVEFTTGSTSAVASITTPQPVLFEAPPFGDPPTRNIRTFEMEATLRDDGSVSGTWSIYYASSGARRTGRVTCFTMIDSLVWVAGAFDSTAVGTPPFGAGSQLGWRAVTSPGSPDGTGDKLSMAHSLEPEALGTADDFCAEALTAYPNYGNIQTFSLLSGDIVMSGTTPGRTAGSVRVIARMSGDGADADGYTVRVGTKTRRLSTTTLKADTIYVHGVPAGRQAVSLEGLAPNCSENTSDSVSVSVGQSATLLLFTECRLATAGVRVSTRTIGPDPDPDGYEIRALSQSGSVQWVSMPHTGGPVTIYGPVNLVELSGTATNCDVVGDNPKLGGNPVTGFVDVTFEVTCAATTTLAYSGISGDNEDIYVVKSNGYGSTRITTHPATDREPAWSPSGARIAFRSDREGNANIYVMNADGSGLLRLTSDSAADYSPAWSPDGAAIVFVSERDGNAELYVMDADGGSVKRLTNDPAPDESPAWSPDGKSIAFRSERHGNGEIYTMNADGSNVVRLTSDPKDDTEPAWSPDGTMLAFSRFTNLQQPEDYDGWQGYDAMIMHANGSNSRPLVVSGPAVGGYVESTRMRNATWSPDGRHVAIGVYYCWSDGDCHTIQAIWLVNVVSGEAREMFRGVEAAGSPQVFPYHPSWRPTTAP